MYLMLLSVNDVNSFIRVQYRFNFVQSFNLSCIWAYLIVNTCWVQFYAQSHCPYYDHMLNQKSQNRSDQPTRGWLFYFLPIKSKEKDNFFILIFMVRWGKCTIIIGIDIKEPLNWLLLSFNFYKTTAPFAKLCLSADSDWPNKKKYFFHVTFCSKRTAGGINLARFLWKEKRHKIRNKVQLLVHNLGSTSHNYNTTYSDN